MTRKLVGACLVAVSLSGAVVAAATHAIVEPRVPRPDNVTRPSLLAFMEAVPNPTIVLRVPAPQARVTQAEGQQGSADLNQAYLAFERELVKAGFTVRDRGLLEEILRSNQNLDYRVIQQKIDVQLILEIVSIGQRSYNTDTYIDANSHRERRLKQGEFQITGWHFEGRVVMVGTGEIGGIYAADVVPQALHFVVAGNKVYNAAADGRVDRANVGYGFGPVQAAAPAFVNALLSSLMPARSRLALGLEVAALTPDAIKRLGVRVPKKVRGVLIVGIAPNGRAHTAGLRVGDVIEQFDGREVQSPEDVTTALTLAGPRPLSMRINRGGKAMPVTVPAP